MTDTATLARRIAQGRGDEPADLVIRGARLLDLVTGELVESDIALCGDTIVGTHARYVGKVEHDASGLIAVPGFIDTHLHVESSLVTPLEFERCVLPHGVTTAICDPHEIANVLGVEGIAYFLQCAQAMRMDLRVNLSSCVPATHLETAGARLEAGDLTPMMDHPKVIGLAEFMNFPGVIHRDPGCLAKLEAFAGRPIDGHAPLVRGLDLNAYLSAGIRTDHETTTADEAREKLAKGMAILIREGSVSKDLLQLIPLISRDASPFLAFCTDDRNPLDIGEEGHLDFMIRTAIARGADVLATYRIASLSAARLYGLFDRGFIGPGKRADIVLVEDLAACSVKRVFASGRLVEDALFADRVPVAPVGLSSVKSRALNEADFRVAAREGETPVIGVVPGRIITERLAMPLPSRGDEALPDLAQDAVKVTVIERHGKSGGIATGFVHGFGMKHGAIASSVGHDSHNLCVVGVDEASMAAAANRLIEIGGGFAVADGGVVTAELALPVAGLMSDQPFETVRHGLEGLRTAAKALGVVLAEPFLQVAFLTLPVIPHLKITDKGLVDVDAFDFV
ncbi:MAG TPA: adenine deaminase [Bosea sp. (in: a-proteobacteria)]|jgi:adenine deaminase|uniref:adenine deaminase n=1 Tax=Bosea sp. (in: a-proteobacteria) TaxID=1871050 RepID=UPI002DDCCE1A|nr:adenine deaminase [Bosea sp. (in: a-proteobacteria)]HEV2556342.1 adenine deaminase [Bosea sp. (in: a-proteobacteria)]